MFAALIDDIRRIARKLHTLQRFVRQQWLHHTTKTAKN